MIKSITEKFDTQKLFFVGKIIFILATVVVIVNVIGTTYSKYESIADVSANASVAFYVIEQGTVTNNLSLSGLKPGSVENYQVYVQNYETDGRESDVNLRYTIRVETTTNLPLSYEITRGSDTTNLLTSFTSRQDDDGVYYKDSNVLGTYVFNYDTPTRDVYNIKVTFPDEYKNYPEYYSGAVELFSIIIYAEQVA